MVTSLLKALRAIPHIPFMVRRFSRLADATAAQDWNYVAATLEELHAKGLNSDDTHFRLACAYCMLERWDPAIAEFERIRRSFRVARRTPVAISTTPWPYRKLAGRMSRWELLSLPVSPRGRRIFA